MEKLPKYLTEYLNNLQKVAWPQFDSLPDMDLYMDQLITYADRLNYLLTNNINEKIITSSMINNYVKQEVIQNPINKKYQRDHLSKILTLSALKKVLSIDDIKKFFDLHDIKEVKNDYNAFTEILSEKLKKTSSAVLEVSAESEEPNYQALLIDLLLEAYANVLISEQVIQALEFAKKNKKAKKS